MVVTAGTTGATRPSTSAPGPGGRAALVVWGVWAVMTAAAPVLVGAYGDNVPWWDDWVMVPTLTGTQPVTLGWLWAPHNEHRIPLGKLLYLGLLRPAGRDFRAGMVFQVVALAGLAFAMTRAAGR